ncbi:SDR family NAD(P)-dependent oxidoreductase [Planotetraspora sp. GP83]|uniref:SDR family NAD(P)-dependent oxidoreductase n=1 Tax=Planotetraspora sp. GP83 TaxID=3156264 RepID=UPI003516DE56
MNEESGRLAGKAVVVTGAGRGVGAAIALLAARQGAAVVVNDLDAEPAEEVASQIVADGGLAVAHAADVADWEQAGGLVQRAVDEFGKLDGLVNNAGVFRVRPIAEEDETSLRRVLEINVLGTAYPGLHAIRHMVERGSGSIVNVTSGAIAGIPGMSVYGASKGAIASLTYGWAIDLRGSGVRVNALSPLAYSRMTETQYDFEGLDEAAREKARAGMPQPADNAPVVVYLLSDRSAGVDGQAVQIRWDASVALLTHPAAMEGSAAGSATSLRSVEEAFDGPLKATIQPLGITTVRVEQLS